jgi:hypothetical protein
VKESKEARKERQAQEEWAFVDLLRRAGNQVAAEQPIRDDRKWKIDYVIFPRMDMPLALEIEGYGRHQSWAGWHADLEKYNAIAAKGLRLVRVTREMITSGNALQFLADCGVPVEAKP